MRVARLGALAAVAATQVATPAGGAEATQRPVLELTATVEPRPLQGCASASWRFRLTNRARRPAHLRFPSSQLGEIVLTRGGAEVYRRSDTRGFADVVRRRTLAAGGSWAFTLKDVLRAPAGRYVMTVRLTATAEVPARLAVRTPVVVRVGKTCGVRDSPVPAASVAGRAAALRARVRAEGGGALVRLGRSARTAADARRRAYAHVARAGRPGHAAGGRAPDAVRAGRPGRAREATSSTTPRSASRGRRPTPAPG